MSDTPSNSNFESPQAQAVIAEVIAMADQRAGFSSREQKVFKRLINKEAKKNPATAEKLKIRLQTSAELDDFKTKIEQALVLKNRGENNQKLKRVGKQTSFYQTVLQELAGLSDDPESQKISAEISKNPEKTTGNSEFPASVQALETKYERFASIPAFEFLKLTAAEIKQTFFAPQGNSTFKVNFRGNPAARMTIGVARAFDVQYLEVDGKLGERGVDSGFNSSRVGFLYQRTKYLAIMGGEIINPQPDQSKIDQFVATYKSVPAQTVKVGSANETALNQKHDQVIHETERAESEINNGENLKGEALLRHPPFAEKLTTVARSLSIQKDWLIKVMRMESGLNPKAKNPYGSATGLIQFLESTAGDLGTTTRGKDGLRYMSGVGQLDFVQKYFQRVKDRHRVPLRSFEDVYAAVFCPAMLGQADDYIIYGDRGLRLQTRAATDNPVVFRARQERLAKTGKTDNRNIITKADFYYYAREKSKYFA